MKIEHIAIWTPRLETLKAYYEKYFDGKAGKKYENHAKQYQSYFLSFESGCRLEIMSSPGMKVHANNPVEGDYQGITHFAFQEKGMMEVDKKAIELKQNGYEIINGPRTTGDGYYEFVTLDPDNNRVEVSAPAV